MDVETNTRWTAVVLAWVNSLEENRSNYGDVMYISESEFLSDLIVKIYTYDDRNIPVSNSNQELADKFMEDYFPECFTDKRICLENQEDLLILFTLLIYSSCIKCQITEIIKKNCTFIKGNVEEILQRFFEEMIKISRHGKFTKKSIIQVVKQCLEPPVVHPRYSFSPGPSSNSLKEFFDSPALQDRKNKDVELKRLKAILEEEQNERADLLERNQSLEEQAKKTQLILMDKIKENAQLKEDLNQILSEKCDPVQTGINETSRQNQIDELVTELKQMKMENDDLINEHEKHIYQITELKDKVKNLEILLDKQFKQIEEGELKLIDIENQNCTLQNQVKELNQIIEQLEESRSNDKKDISYPNIEENIGKSIIDLQLKEKQVEIERLQSDLSLLKEKFETELKGKVFSLQSEIQLLKEEIKGKNARILNLEEGCSELINTTKLVKSLQTEILSVQTIIKTSQDELIAKDLVIDELKERLKYKEDEILEINKCDSEKTEVINKYIVENKQLKNNVSELSLQSKEKNEQITSLELCLRLQEENVVRLNVDLDNKITELKEKEFELITVQSDITQKITEISGLKESVANLNLELELANKSFSDQIKVLEEKNFQLETVLKDKNKLFNKEIDLLNQQILAHDPQLKEAYDKLFDHYNRLTDDYKTLNSQLKSVTSANSNMRVEYDAKLKKMKDNMKETCTRIMQQKEEACKKVKQHEEVITSNQNHITQLRSQLWDTSDKLIVTKREKEDLEKTFFVIKKENEELKKTVIELKKTTSHQNVAVKKERTHSYEHHSHTPPEMQFDVNESLTITRRQSIRTVPSGMGIKLLQSGKVFPSEDEAEEMFNNECLADLKAGRCQVTSDPDRVSTLQYRNSLCPPHLKSSYPAETQFLPIDTIREDDIKGRSTDDDTKSLLSEKQRRKDRSKTLELKPIATPRNPLREQNDVHKKPGTPSRLFSQFFTVKHRDENTPTTPYQRRLSFFNKHFGGKREVNQKLPE